MKLPKNDLPKFYGNYRNVIEFRNLFENLVHNNFALSNVQKLYLLKTSLVNKAAEIIKDFPISEAAYIEAWTTFTNRYDNKRKIITALLTDFFSLQKIKSEKEIRTLLDSLNRIMRGLKIVGEHPENWSLINYYWLWSRIDDSTRREFDIRQSDNSKFSVLKTVMTFLSQRAATLKECKTVILRSVQRKDPD